MPHLNLRNITNSFQEVRLASLASWKQASEIAPRDRGGPYVVPQEGYDPEDRTMTGDEFVLGRSGRWLSIGVFCRLPVPERRAEYVFGTAAEVMEIMSKLPPKPVVVRLGDKAEATPAAGEPDEMAAAIQAGKNQPPGAAT